MFATLKITISISQKFHLEVFELSISILELKTDTSVKKEVPKSHMAQCKNVTNSY